MTDSPFVMEVERSSLSSVEPRAPSPTGTLGVLWFDGLGSYVVLRFDGGPMVPGDEKFARVELPLARETFPRLPDAGSVCSIGASVDNPVLRFRVLRVLGGEGRG